MIDKAKLQALDLITLSQLREAVVDVLHRKMRMQAHRGFEVLSPRERNGERIRVRVTGSGPQNLTGYIIDQHGNHLMRSKYRISPHLAEVVPDYQSKPIAISRPLRTAQDQPGSVPASAF